MNLLQAEIQILHSGRTNNNRYTNTPVRYARKPFCEFLDDFYVKVIMKEMAPPVSDLPQVEEKGVVCDLMLDVCEKQLSV